MALYEVVLRFRDREEVRLTDRPLEVGHTVRIEGAEWLVERRHPRRGAKAARYVCTELRTRSEPAPAQPLPGLLG